MKKYKPRDDHLGPKHIRNNPRERKEGELGEDKRFNSLEIKVCSKILNLAHIMKDLCIFNKSSYKSTVFYHGFMFEF